eukprot:410438_1
MNHPNFSKLLTHKQVISTPQCHKLIQNIINAMQSIKPVTHVTKYIHVYINKDEEDLLKELEDYIKQMDDIQPNECKQINQQCENKKLKNNQIIKQYRNELNTTKEQINDNFKSLRETLNQQQNYLADSIDRHFDQIKSNQQDKQHEMDKMLNDLYQILQNGKTYFKQQLFACKHVMNKYDKTNKQRKIKLENIKNETIQKWKDIMIETDAFKEKFNQFINKDDQDNQQLNSNGLSSSILYDDSDEKLVIHVNNAIYRD